MTDHKTPNYYEKLGIFLKSDEATILRALQKYAQTAQTIEDLEFLKACKEHLLNPEKRKQYNRILLSENPRLLIDSGEIAAEETQQAQQYEQAYTTQHQAKKQAWIKRMILLLSIIFVPMVIVMWVSNKGTSSKHSELSASRACEQAVAQHMKSPTQTTVKFERYQLDGNTYTFHGSVNAPNSFGVMLQQTVVCTATHKGGKDYTTDVRL